MSLFQKASKQQARAKILLDGVSGAGKTHTLIRLLRGLVGIPEEATTIPAGKIAIIDTENHSVEKKSNALLGSIVEDPNTGIGVANLEDRSVDSYIRFIKDAVASGYQALGIDSITHGWDDLKREVDILTNTKYGGNSWRAWSDKNGTAKYNAFRDAMVFSKIHIVATSRVGVDWVTETNERGKQAPKRVGLKTDSGKSIESEFDFFFRLDDAHYATCIKDRYDMGLQDKVILKPGEALGKQIADYLSDGDSTAIEIIHLMNVLNLNDKQRQAARDKYPDPTELLGKLKEQVK